MSFVHKNLIRFFESGVKGRRVFAHLRDLERSQWLTPEELQKTQLVALRRLVGHAERTCPYYAEQWRILGLSSASLESLDDLAKWPIIDRDTIRQHRSGMRTAAPGHRLISKSTGGSSGVPLHFDLDTGSHDRRTAAAMRGYDWAGCSVGGRHFYLWGGAIGHVPRWRQWKEHLYYRCLYRRLILNTFDFREDRIEDYVAAWNRFRPEAIVAYTGPLYAFARAVRDRGLTLAPPKSVIVGAEKLHDFQRTLIEKVVRAPVFETYGSREVMLIGAECERHEGLHLTSENLLVEVCDDDGRPTPEGEEGNVVITDLYNYGMPFIRYMNGDRTIAGWKQCSCGRGLPLMRQMVGRQLDIVQASDGRLVPGEFFPHLLKDYAAVRRFQVVQEEPELVQVRLVVNDQWQSGDEQNLKREIQDVLGDGTLLQISVEDDIPLTAAGKFQVVVNRCGKVLAEAGV